jgi:heat-inducible transcriptional repressor
MVDPTKLASRTLVEELDERSRLLFRQIVETYLETGEPVGSRTLARATPLALSPATIRNVMADLEQMGLLVAPHTSAGRLPTQLGLRLFVDGLLEVGTLAAPERAEIEKRLAGSGQSVEDLLTLATTMLSGLSGCAGVVVAPKLDAALKHVEFVSMGPGKALAIIVSEGGAVENRILEVPLGMPPSALVEATNFLNARLRGRTLDEAREEILIEIEEARAELDRLAAKVIELGLATWSGSNTGAGAAREGAGEPQLIVRGQAHLLENVTAAEDLERIRMLFDDLEGKKDVIQLLDLAKEADGVRIFIGSENKLFSLSGSSLIVAPYKNARSKIVGVLGVIGPTRLNYARVIPMVDYTARVMSRLVK